MSCRGHHWSDTHRKNRQARTAKYTIMENKVKLIAYWHADFPKVFMFVMCRVKYVQIVPILCDVYSKSVLNYYYFAHVHLIFTLRPHRLYNALPCHVCAYST